MATSRIRVVVRVRPRVPNEAGHPCQLLSVHRTSKSVQLSSSAESKRFQFDQVFDGSSSQQEVYDHMGFANMLGAVLGGYNATIFAYGQTGSGKTYTMEGYEYEKLRDTGSSERVISRARLETQASSSDRLGVIPRVIFDLFAQISTASLSPSGRREFVVRCSFVQIYNEQIMDLLNPSHLQQAAAAKRSRAKHQPKARSGLRLRWSAAREFYVENLCVLECESPEQVLAHFHSGLQHKVMASHRMNAASSRSHCIFTLYVESFDPSDNPNDVLTSKLALVDLAGSERVERTGATGVTLQESIGINKSLFVLRQVIQALSEESNAVPAKELLVKAPSDRAYIPYRDSKLTSLLKDSLGGNSVTLMIACVSPSDASFDENMSTLVYASKAQCIANRPTKNEDPKTALVHELQQEVESLRRQLSQAHATILSFQQMTPALPTTTTSNSNKEDLPKASEPEAKTLPGSLPSEPDEKPAVRRETTTTKQLKWNVIENVDMIKQLYATEKQLSERVRSQVERIDALQYETRVLNVENQSLREKMEVLEYLVATAQPETQDDSNNGDESQELSEIPEYGALSKQSTPLAVPTAERIRRALRHKASPTSTPTTSKRKSKIAPHVESSNHSSGSRREPESTGLLSLSELKDLLAGGKQTKRAPMAVKPPRTAPQSTGASPTHTSDNQQQSLPRSTTASILSTLRQRTTSSVLEQDPLEALSELNRLLQVKATLRRAASSSGGL